MQGPATDKKMLMLTVAVKRMSATCFLNVVAVGIMAWWAFGVSENNDSIIEQRAEQVINARAQDICNQCVEQFARRQGLKIVGIDE